MLEMREGGCHCGRIRFRACVDLDLDDAFYSGRNSRIFASSWRGLNGLAT
jgi:hypothetical protein